MVRGPRRQLLGERLGEADEASALVGGRGQFEHQAATVTSTGTPWATMSKTADRAWARSTISRSFSGGRVALDLEVDADVA